MIGGKKMLGAIIIYKFELSQSETGDITPQFIEIAKESTEELRDVLHESSIIIDPLQSASSPSGIISLDDLYGIFYNLTTGKTKDNTKRETEVVEQTLQDTPYKVLSHFFQLDSEHQYLYLAFFDAIDTLDEFYPLFGQLSNRITVAIRYSNASAKESQYVIITLADRLKYEIKNIMLQVERFFNLTKTQKLAIIFSSPERSYALEELRKGPVSRAKLEQGLQKFKKIPNVDAVMKTFLELNIVRRDWVKPYFDKKTKTKFEEGEYYFLIRDIALIRKHPAEIFAKLKKDSNIGKKYETRLVEFFHRYNPFSDLIGESKKLAKYLLDSEVYDLLALLKTQYYPMDKFPKVLTDMGELEDLIVRLREDELVYVIQDQDERRWVCLLNEIVPLVTFPEYLVEEITEKTAIKKQTSKTSKSQQLKREISPEVGKMALKFLQSSYYDTIEV
jgi:hypothetical protein